MSGLKEQYIEASSALIKEGVSVSDVTKGLEETMTRRGHLQLLPRVLRGLLEWTTRQEQVSAPRLTLARESDTTHFVKEAKGANIEIDPSLIGGFIKREGFIETDNSYKTKLLRWYRSSIR